MTLLHSPLPHTPHWAYKKGRPPEPPTAYIFAIALPSFHIPTSAASFVRAYIYNSWRRPNAQRICRLYRRARRRGRWHRARA